MRNNPPSIFLVLATLAILALTVSCEYRVWRECRDAGNSRLYCYKLVSR